MEERILKNAYIIHEINKIKNKAHQLAIVASLLMDETTWDVCPSVEESFSTDKGDFRVDLCYKDLKWIVEIDEKHHLTPKQVQKDKIQDASLDKLGYKTTRIIITKEKFLHVDAVKELKSELRERMEKWLNFKKWIPKSFNKERAIKDDPKLIFVNKTPGNNSLFPDFKLGKQYHNLSNLRVAILMESPSVFADKNLKMIESVYNVEYLQSKENSKGYVTWSGNPIEHSVISSGDTIVNLSSGPYHDLEKLFKKK